MPKQNFTQNLSLSLEFEIRSCTIYYNQLALHSYNMNAEICWQTNWSIMKAWNMYCRYCIHILWKHETCTACTAFIYYESMKHVLHSCIMKAWNMYCMYCIHIFWKYETCTAFMYYESMKHVLQVLHSYIMKVWTCTAFIYYETMKHVLHILHSFIIVWRNMFNLITPEHDHIKKFHPKGIYGNL